MQHQDFLIEIGTEELPANLLQSLANSFSKNITQQLKDAALEFEKSQTYATPRRLAVLITQLAPKQADRFVEKRGPALRAAYDAQGNPTQALLGFARSCNADIKRLEKLETEQGSWLIYRFTEKGKTVKALLPTIIQNSLKELPIPKTMRWGSTAMEFIRPIRWIVMLYGATVIPATLFGLKAGQTTYGHRFLTSNAIKLQKASDYAQTLKTKGHVIADFQERRTLIQKEILNVAKKIHAEAIIDDNLLDEVTGLVEWPVALIIPFDKVFLKLPRKVLITSMQHHQKCFPLQSKQRKLLPQFITISNLKSKKPSEIIQGNERVMRARLDDARFFYETDCKKTLIDYLEKLRDVIFQNKLGTLYDKSKRIAALAEAITPDTDKKELAKRAGELCKADLVTLMVGEFPELQGMMGYYYAKLSGEDEQIALAIRDHYHPRFYKDTLPETDLGCAVAIADRVDTLTGIFAIKQIPTGDKDPFGLRRAALGILRILIEKQIPSNLHKVIAQTKLNYSNLELDQNFSDQVYEFITERLYAWCEEKNINADRVTAVKNSKNPNHSIPLNIVKRIFSINKFLTLEEAKDFIEINKRIKNILKDYPEKIEHISTAISQCHSRESGNPNSSKVTEMPALAGMTVNKNLFEFSEEKKLYEKICEKYDHLSILKKYEETSYDKLENHYSNYLHNLLDLKQPIHDFFEKVFVNVEDQDLKNNRLELLASIRYLFLYVADFSLLQI